MGGIGLAAAVLAFVRWRRTGRAGALAHRRHQPTGPLTATSIPLLRATIVDEIEAELQQIVAEAQREASGATR